MSRTLNEFARLAPVFLELFSQPDYPFGEYEAGAIRYAHSAQVLIEEIGTVGEVRMLLDVPAYSAKFEQLLDMPVRVGRHMSLQRMAALLAFHYRHEIHHPGYFLMLFETGALHELLESIGSASRFGAMRKRD